jgi:hypothetical protein
MKVLTFDCVFLTDDISSWCVLLAAAHKENVERILLDSPRAEIQAFTLQYSLRVLTDGEFSMSVCLPSVEGRGL